MIIASNISKTYKVVQKEEGLHNSFKGLFHRKYRKVEAVKNIDFSISDGEIVGLIGLNGAGKTTTLKMLSGLIKPASGTITVDGFDPWEKQPDYLKRIGFLMGNKSQLSWDIPAIDTFRLERKIYNIAHEEFEKTLLQLARLLSVEDLLETPVRKLSLGQRMKMEMILTLLHQPKILFLDEPTLGLDIISQQNIREFLMKYRIEKNATILITSHNMRDIEDICDRAIIINQGELLYDGSIEKIKKRYDSYQLVTILYDNANFMKDLDRKLKEIPFEIQKESSNKVILKLQTNSLDKLKNNIMTIEGIQEISFDKLSFEAILTMILRGR